MGAFFESDEEMGRRAMLLRLAARGNPRAQQKLEEEYHVRVYSADERARFVPKVAPGDHSVAVRRKVDQLLSTERTIESWSD